MFDLKQLRERAGLTQAQLAQRLNTNQVQISRYEVTPGNVPVSMIQTYLAALGLDLATEISRATNQPSVVPVVSHQPYQTLRKQLKLTIASLDSISQSAPQTSFIPQTEDLTLILRQIIQKPRLLITGNFDAGKSHLANYFIGKHCLPTGYQPVTRIPIYLRHLDDRPAFIKEEVWIMDEGFIPAQWADRTHAMAHKKIAGNLSTLNDWASHAGKFNDTGCGAALVFTKASLLKSCEIIDIPGNLYSQQDKKWVESALPQADIVLYASPAKGFINGNDLIQLYNFRQKMQALHSADRAFKTSHLAVIATHADPSIDDHALTDILRRGTNRMQSEWRSQCRLNNIEVEVFSFWEELPNRNQALLNWLQRTLGNEIPAAKIHRARSLVNKFSEQSKQCCTSRIAGLQKLLASDLECIMPGQQINQAENRQQLIIARIRELQQSNSEQIKQLFLQQLVPERVVQIITEHFPERSQARQFAAAHLTNQLQNQAGEHIGQQLTMLLPQIQQYIEDFHQPALIVSIENQQQSSAIAANTRGFLLGGAAGLAGVGPFAAWASQLGPWGGYLVFAEGASAIGMSAAATSTLITAVAAIGGPAVLAAAMVATGTMIGASVMGRSWQTRLAEQLIRSIKTSGFEARLKAESFECWNQVIKQFERNSQYLKKDLQQNHDALISIKASADPKAHLQKLILETENYNKLLTEQGISF